MYSCIGVMNRPENLTVEEWRRWWVEHHVPKVLALPGLIDYVIWPVDEELDWTDFSFVEPRYTGVAVISFESKEAFLAAFRTPAGDADVQSVNESAPDRLVFGGQPYVIKSGLRETGAPEGFQL